MLPNSSHIRFKGLEEDRAKELTRVMASGFDDDPDDVLQTLKMMKEYRNLAYKYNRELDAQMAVWVGVSRNIDKYTGERLTRLLNRPRGGHRF